MTNAVTRKLTITGKVPLEDGDCIEIEHETGNDEIYVRLWEENKSRVLTTFTAAQAEQLANALLVVAQKMREEEASRD